MGRVIHTRHAIKKLIAIGCVSLMAIAPLVAGWQRVNRNLPAPIYGETPKLGTAVLQAQYGGQVRLLIEIAFGAIRSQPEGGWPWKDVTSDVLQHDGEWITWSIGQANETSATLTATASFILKNNAGYGPYSANNPLSPNWPNVVKNTPVRIRMSSDYGNTWWIMWQGGADGFPPSMDSTGKYVVANVTASGTFRRLNQGTTPLISALKRVILADNPLAYWTLEDGTNATSAQSAVIGQKPLRELVDDGTAYGLPDFASVSAAQGSNLLPNFANGSAMFTTISGGTAGTNGWATDTVINAGTTVASTDLPLFVKFFAGSTSYYIEADETNVRWGLGYTTNNGAAGSFLATPTFASTVNPFDGNGHMIRILAQQSGSGVNWWLVLDNTIVASGTTGSTILSPLTAVQVGGGSHAGTFSVGHIAVWNAAGIPDHTNAMNGLQGESPRDRMSRLCTQNNISFSTVGYYASNIRMGPQTPDTLANLLHSTQGGAEISDAGFLYDGMSSGLLYQGISQRQDQAVSLTLDATASEFMTPFKPLDDDFRFHNKTIVDNLNGSSVTVEDRSSQVGSDIVEVYDTVVTVNHVDDSELLNRANFELKKGTLQGYRYPELDLDLAARPAVGLSWLRQSNGYGGPLVPGSHIQVLNVSSWVQQLPPETIDLCVIGWTMSINQMQWQTKLNCMPNDIYNVFKVGDSQLGRVQTAGASLSSDAAIGAASLTVASGGVVFITTASYASKIPFYILVSGIKVKVTAVTGTTSPQTFTVDGTTVVKALHTGEAVTVWKTGGLSL